MGIRHLYSHADGYQCELAAIGPLDLPAGPLVVYSSSTYVRSGYEGNHST